MEVSSIDIMSELYIRVNGVLYKRQKTENGKYPDEVRREYMKTWRAARKQDNECLLKRKDERNDHHDR